MTQTREAPSTKLVTALRARFTLLVGYACCMLGFLTMLLLWKDHAIAMTQIRLLRGRVLG